MAEGFLERLSRQGWLHADFDLSEPSGLEDARPDAALLQLCELGALKGGLAVALGVRPDELMGTLCDRIGGSAKTVRVVDVRDRPHVELVISYAGREERWDVTDVEGLAHNLNDLLREDGNAAAVAVLGEWQDSLQLWCVPKARLPVLLRERFFTPRNARDLSALLEPSRADDNM